MIPILVNIFVVIYLLKLLKIVDTRFQNKTYGTTLWAIGEGLRRWVHFQLFWPERF